MIVVIGGPRLTDGVDDVGELIAALAAAVACFFAAAHVSSRSMRWVLLGASAFSWAAGEGVWTYYDLIRGVQVPFPSLADVGFLAAVPLAVAGLLLFPSTPRRPPIASRGSSTDASSPGRCCSPAGSSFSVPSIAHTMAAS
jgi:hypothetical protein